jgi:hypothetical protein
MHSNISYDFTKIFDDVMDPMSGDIETTSTAHHKEYPPLLSGRQSSMFSMVNFTDWQQEMGNEGHHLIKPSNSSTMIRRLSLIDEDVPQSGAAVAPFDELGNGPMILSTLRNHDHLDRNSMFGGGATAAHTSPTHNPTSNSNPELDLQRISPQEVHYHDHSSSMVGYMDMIEDSSIQHHPIPLQQATAPRTITENEEYRTLCQRLEVSMAKLESEELEHRSWEAHNEALWRHFIQEQPDLAKLLNTRIRDDAPNPVRDTGVQDIHGGRSSQVAAISNTKREENHHSMESWKWQPHLFGGDMEEGWEAV